MSEIDSFFRGREQFYDGHGFRSGWVYRYYFQVGQAFFCTVGVGRVQFSVLMDEYSNHDRAEMMSSQSRSLEKFNASYGLEIR